MIIIKKNLCFFIIFLFNFSIKANEMSIEYKEDKPFIIILLGPPGAGKGTQAKQISKLFSIPHISVGDIIREEALHGSSIAMEVKKITDEGKFIPDDLVLKIIEKRISKEINGYILDGFPRNIFQAYFLEKMLSDLNQELTVVFSLNVSPELITERIIYRRTCPNCGAVFNLTTKVPKKEGQCDFCKNELIHRGDDHEDKINFRLSLYNNETVPIIQYYENKEILKEISANESILEVENEIIEYLQNK
ncbi:MAG: adenylate kinase [Candidatus Anoxychlamydiales bacterium]|nr:adenylate kinase [Candidatus Anoxychlamydiales bacterium]